MNIAILIPSLGGGGAERAAQLIGNYYVEKGNNVYFFLAEEKQDYPVKGKVIRTNIKRCMENEVSDLKRMFILFRSSLEIRRLKKKYEIDIAISFMEEFNYLNVLSKGKERVITRVGTVISQRDEFVGLLYKKSVVRFFYSRADKVIAVSQDVLRDMYQYYRVPIKKLMRIPNMSIDFSDMDYDADWKFGNKAVLSIGRLMVVKQQERIIRAFSYVCRKEPEARLIILGKGPQLRYLKKTCENLQIEDKVEFIGFTDKIAFYLKHAKVFVMASRIEGFPNSMIEAMHYGVPIVSTDSLGGCGEIIGRPNRVENVDSEMYCKYGILTPNIPGEKLKFGTRLAREEIVLGSAILKVLTNNKVYQRYRRQSFRRAAMFSKEKIFKMWNQVLYEK